MPAATPNTDVAPRPRVTVYGFSSDPHRPDGSPFVNRLRFLLHLSGVAFALKTGDLGSSPRGKLPYLVLEPDPAGSDSNNPGAAPAASVAASEAIADSSGAYDALVRKGLAEDLDRDLSAWEKAKTRALEALVGEVVWLTVKERWVDNFHLARDKYALAKLPYLVRFIVGRFIVAPKMARDIATLGYTTRPQSELDGIRDSALDALATLLTAAGAKQPAASAGGDRFALGLDRPTTADTIVFGAIAACLVYPGWNPEMHKAITARPALTKYADTFKARVGVSLDPIDP